jgi:hypothetical protein
VKQVSYGYFWKLLPCRCHALIFDIHFSTLLGREVWKVLRDHLSVYDTFLLENCPFGVVVDVVLLLPSRVVVFVFLRNFSRGTPISNQKQSACMHFGNNINTLHYSIQTTHTTLHYTNNTEYTPLYKQHTVHYIIQTTHSTLHDTNNTEYTTLYKQQRVHSMIQIIASQQYMLS